MDDGLGDLDFENSDEKEEQADADNEWEILADKYEILERKVEELLNDEQNLGSRKPPIVSAPPKMNQEEWEQHQATHTHTISARLQTLCSSPSRKAQTSQKEETPGDCARC